jgi:hypothetical protein
MYPAIGHCRLMTLTPQRASNVAAAVESIGLTSEAQCTFSSKSLAEDNGGDLADRGRTASRAWSRDAAEL